MIVSELEDNIKAKVKSRTFNSSRQANRTTLAVSSSQQKNPI